MCSTSSKRLLLALCIGDGYLYKDRNCLSIGHGQLQKDYLQHKADLLSSLLYKKVKIYSTISKLGYESWRLKVSHKYFRFIRERLYKNNEKVISEKILSKLDNKCFAYWYMDDGSLYSKKKAGKVHAYEMVLSTCCPIEQASIILNWLEERFDVKGTLKKDKQWYSIRFGTKAAKIIAEAIKPYIIESMLYKVTFH